MNNDTTVDLYGEVHRLLQSGDALERQQRLAVIRDTCEAEGIDGIVQAFIAHQYGITCLDDLSDRQVARVFGFTCVAARMLREDRMGSHAG